MKIPLATHVVRDKNRGQQQPQRRRRSREEKEVNHICFSPTMAGTSFSNDDYNQPTNLLVFPPPIVNLVVVVVSVVTVS